MIYSCEDCNFLFQRTGEPSECPLCERKCIRAATDKEVKRFFEILNLKTIKNSEREEYKKNNI